MNRTQRKASLRWQSQSGRIFIMLGVMLFANASSLPAWAGSEQKNIPDEDITLAIEQELLESGEVAAHRIDTTTREGIVTLSGSVDNLLAKRRAVELAQAIKGVRGVVEKIELVTPQMEDEALRDTVAAALLFDPATEKYGLSVEADENTITLTGTVDSYQEKVLAEQIAAGVRGVREVENRIDMDYAAERSDDEVRDDVLARLSSSIWIESALIDVKVENGDVSLEGTVGSAAEKSRAEQAAWVAGTQSVDTTDLKVEWWLREEMKRENRYPSPKSDEIADAIRDAFLYDPRVKSFNPEIEVEEGIVTLTGTVSSLTAKNAAGRDARNVPGVLMVNNHLRVRSEAQPTDPQIMENVEQALLRDPYVYRFEITPSIVNGHAYLYGAVDTAYEKRRAEEIVSTARGVVDVNNYLKVEDGWTFADDFKIERRIHDQLFWSPFVDAEDIDVKVKDGIATLSGQVDSRNERDLARQNAYEGGARSVILDLDLQGS